MLNSSIYARLACTNLKNNHKTYIPYMLMATLTVMMFFIMDNLSLNREITNASLQLLLEYAVGVILVFAVIFLFYTNSFLIRRRKKEIGVYNILGMGKRHVAKMLTIETMIVTGSSISIGLLGGIVFGKFMYLIFRKLLRYDIGMQFHVSVIAVQKTTFVFAMIFLLILIYNLMQIRISNPIELLHGGSRGEKEPKTKWFLAIVGVVMLGIGYGIAFVVQKPLEALGGFFIAVICVIIGTYALFTAGSIAVLKMLKNNKHYYYQTSHFTTISGMLYRMKQNAAGLANICILSTMVLVMVSTTCSLYTGMHDILDYRFPKEFTVHSTYESDEKIERISQVVEEELEKQDFHMENVISYNGGWIAGFLKQDTILLHEVMDYTAKDVCTFTFLSLDDYNESEKQTALLSENELLLYSEGEKYGKDTLTIEGKTYHVKEELVEMKLAENNNNSMEEGYYIVLPDRARVQEMIDLHNANSRVELDYMNRFSFDVKGKGNETMVANAVVERLQQEFPDSYCESRALGEQSFYELYGSLLFIGIYLGAMFLMATVLIIYYKQISEGCDDRERYQIMQKVGMSRTEVKRSIRSQVLTVFFLPLLTAILHNIVAFRIVKMLLRTLNMVNVPLYLASTVVTVLVFAVFYVMVYSVTAREYYKIVNE